jgi:hypothetical protein
MQVRIGGSNQKISQNVVFFKKLIYMAILLQSPMVSVTRQIPCVLFVFFFLLWTGAGAELSSRLCRSVCVCAEHNTAMRFCSVKWRHLQPQTQ